MFAGTFPPVGWMFCEGQLLAISDYDVLFQLIGTTYGGDGQSTFALPDLRGRVPIHLGNGFVQGQSGGTEAVTLTSQQIPIHAHAFLASADQASSPNPGAHVLAETISTTPYFAGTPFAPLAPQSIVGAGGSQPHTNMQPFLCVDFIISLQGIFPSQN
jgi:microcystin-dependent protein